jgi:Reverse transcriptase (RNA-dependent DNA polymerase)
MEEEIRAIEKITHWNLVTLTTNKKVIDVKLVYKIKRDAYGSINCYKVCLVVKRYRLKYDIDYDEVFALIAHLNIERMLISFTTYHDWILHQLDVKSAFLNRG